MARLWGVSSPGWYPDPSGQPQSFRYWDGQTWSEQTTSNPYSPAPGAVAPGDVGPGDAAPQVQFGQGTPVADPAATGEVPVVEPWIEQPAEQAPVEQWGQQPGYGEGAPYNTGGQPQWGQQPAEQWGQQRDYGQQGGYGEQPTSQFAAQQPGFEQWGQQPGGSGFGTPPPSQWAPMPGGGDGGNGGGKKIGLLVGGIVLALVLVVGIVVAAITLTGGDSDEASGSDETSQTDEPTDASESPSESPTESTESPSDDFTASGVPVELCTSGRPEVRGAHPEDGRLHGGGLSVEKPKGYQLGAFERAFTFASDVATVYREIEAKWVSVHALGSVSKAAAGSDIEAATRAVMACIAESPDFYSDVTDTTELESKAIEVDGRSGWLVRQQVLIDSADVEAAGDELVVILVETDDPDNYGFYNGGATIDDKISTTRLEETIESLQVD